jgi:hypothetical protein
MPATMLTRCPRFAPPPRYHVGKLALFLIPAEKLHSIPALSGGNDSLPQRHHQVYIYTEFRLYFRGI